MAPERRLFAGSSPRGENADRECGRYFGRDLVEPAEDAGLSDVHMASRRAEEAAIRRYQASKWLQEMLGSLGLSNEPSEEEFRLTLRNGIVLCNLLNKINPGHIPKIVENPVPTSPSDGAHSAYQYFENVRNFLGAIDDMQLPSFEVPVLAEGGLSAGSLTKVVDCILALKSYYEWKQGKSFSPWRYAVHNKPGSTGSKSPSRILVDDSFNRFEEPHLASTPRSTHSRKRWAIPTADIPDANDFPLSYEAGTPNCQQETNGSHKGFDDTENHTMSPAARLHQIGQKFRDALHMKRFQDLQTSDLDSSSTLKPSQSLPNLVKSIISDKQPDEIPMLVEFMMKKVVEEFEKRHRTQSEQVKKLKGSLKELMARENKLSSRAKVLEALAAGSGEEIKLVTQQLQQTKAEKENLDEEKLTRERDIGELLLEKEEKQRSIETLRSEVNTLKGHQLEVEARQAEVIADYKIKVSGMETELASSLSRIERFEEDMALERSRGEQREEKYKEREEKYKEIISAQSEVFKYLKSASEGIRADALDMQNCWQDQLTALETELRGLTEAAQSYHDVLAENRRLYNEVQDLKGNIRVYCRVRPFLVGQPDQTCIDYVGENGEITISTTTKQGKDTCRTFNFNKVYGPQAAQEEVFVDAQPLIRSVLDGYNVCIFAYGQTGSGKTYTMAGPSTEAREAWGVNYRALHDLFQLCQKRRDSFAYEVGVQMIEIYNEQVRDLLAADGVSKRLGIRTSSSNNGVHVPEAVMIPVTSSNDVLEIMAAGQRNRAVGATALNERSSRSHSVLTVHVQSLDLVKSEIFRGCLHLVDLAGSERVEKSEATGDRLKEAQHINKSLSALGDVIAALAQKSAHIPYRNSKLTQLLQHSLGGQAKALMFVHVNPDTDSYNETISTLKFAERVSGVELGAARTNREGPDVRDFKEQIQHLKDMLAKKDTEMERHHVPKLVRSSSSDLDKQRLGKNRLSFDSRGLRKSLNGRAAEAAWLSSSHNNSRASSRDPSSSDESEARKSRHHHPHQSLDSDVNPMEETFEVHQCSTTGAGVSTDVVFDKEEDLSEGDLSQESLSAGSDSSSQQPAKISGPRQLRPPSGEHRSLIPRLPPRSERKAGVVGASFGSVSGLRRLSDVGGVAGVEEISKRGSKEFQSGLLFHTGVVPPKSSKRWV